MPIRVLLQPFFYLPESWNGIDEHLLLLARHLDPAEFELVVAVGEADGPQTATLAQRAGLATVDVPRVSSAPGSVRGLRDLYRRVGADIVHMHTPAAGGQATAAFAARLAGAAPVLTVHQYQPWALPVRTRLLNTAAQRALFRRVIAVSHDVRASLAERAGFSDRRVLVISNGIDAGEPRRSGIPLRSPNDPPVIGYFGRLSREKGVDILIEALALAHDAGCTFEAQIVGDGPERAALEALSVARGLDGRVTFRGFIPGASSLIPTVDIVAHTPRYEGFGLVILEAMAAAKPVIVAPAPGGLAEMVVPGETGLIAGDRSPAEIARAVRTLVADDRLRERMGIAARERWREHFTADRMAARTAEVYRQALGLPSRPEPMPDSLERGDHPEPTPRPLAVNASSLPSEPGATAPRQTL